MELWLVRHGTTNANQEGRLQGRIDFPLGPAGEKEAASLAYRLKKQPFSAFLSSSLLRARQTAQIIERFRDKGPAPLYTPLLQEYHWGIIEGLTREEIKRANPPLFRQLQENFYQAHIPGAEGLQNLFVRVRFFYHFLSRLDRKEKFSQPVLVVGHGRFLHAFIIYFLKYNHWGSWPFSVFPASLTILEGDFAGKRRLKLFNDTCHLKGNPHCYRAP